MSGLIEVADREFDRLNRETALEPGVELYKELERHYYKLTAKRPDPELSLEVAVRCLEEPRLLVVDEVALALVVLVQPQGLPAI